jgi:hypothetical protein
VIGMWKLRAFGGDARTERTSKKVVALLSKCCVFTMIGSYRSSFMIELIVETIPTISLTAV